MATEDTTAAIEKELVAAQAQKKALVTAQSKPFRSAPTSIPKTVITDASFVEDPTAKTPPSPVDINMGALIDEENKRAAVETPWEIILPPDMNPRVNIRSVERLEQLLQVRV